MATTGAPSSSRSAARGARSASCCRHSSAVPATAISSSISSVTSAVIPARSKLLPQLADLRRDLVEAVQLEDAVVGAHGGVEGDLALGVLARLVRVVGHRDDHPVATTTVARPSGSVRALRRSPAASPPRCSGRRHRMRDHAVGDGARGARHALVDRGQVDRNVVPHLTGAPVRAHRRAAPARRRSAPRRRRRTAHTARTASTVSRRRVAPGAPPARRASRCACAACRSRARARSVPPDISSRSSAVTAVSSGERPNAQAIAVPARCAPSAARRRPAPAPRSGCGTPAPRPSRTLPPPPRRASSTFSRCVGSSSSSPRVTLPYLPADRVRADRPALHLQLYSRGMERRT